MGGLMSLYALLAYNDVFSRAAALSPSLWVAPAALMNLTARTKLASGTVLYMDYGSKEMGNHEGMRKGFGEMCGKIFARGINLTARVVPGGTHSEASWEKQLPFVLNKTDALGSPSGRTVCETDGEGTKGGIRDGNAVF